MAPALSQEVSDMCTLLCSYPGKSIHECALLMRSAGGGSDASAVLCGKRDRGWINSAHVSGQMKSTNILKPSKENMLKKEIL